MSQQLVQVNFQYKGSGEEYEEAAASVAEMFASLPGLIWKIWLQNREKKEGGGIYLFMDSHSVETYRNSPLFKHISASGDYANFSIRQYDMLETPGVITHAPVGSITLS